MSSAEFAEWMAYERLEGPLGPAREDWRAAQITAMVASVNRDPKRRRQPYSPHDFIPDWAKEAGVKVPMTAGEVADKVKGAFQAMAAKGRRMRRQQ